MPGDRVAVSGVDAWRPADGRATIVDVAAAAGVSRQTVTRAMNDMPGISPRTKARVLAAAQELQYRPSRFGRGLVKPSQRTLGLLVTDLTNPYYPELASAVIGAAAERGWSVVLAEEKHATDHRRQVRELAGQVDALVGYVGAEHPGRGEDTDERLGVPLVQVDVEPHQTDHGGVVFSPRLGVEQAIEHLAGFGVRRPVMIDSAGPDLPSRRGRLFVDGWAARGVDALWIPAGDATVTTGVSGLERALGERPDLDAVLAFNDVMALGVLSALRGHGIGVPDQVRVIGVDGLSLGELANPRLTTIAIDLAVVARLAVELAVGMDGGTVPRSGPGARRSVSYQLHVRESA
ncbi:DNA-binding LacI/PurR family transcriptional regulator [Friedmanniella endophytica]|uniref:DNA-binding LacI/PurR family transcriptional regulator n=1 Tax=Microlunatus kandeliicorticis TaxID=1759536 RepID=A0A7W3ISD3_9ACTN|nr:LacI family DNA-binding transcriptional regulator [Microlunatus kandeliicorticis]MBA8794361.1 DNA-binding LacI/PurR family transcriptional regulator [Microlunatus kandeliicorticis]